MMPDYLKRNYELGEPIFTEDVDMPGMSEEDMRCHLKKLTDEGILYGFEAGIYYSPDRYLWGENGIDSGCRCIS